MKLLNIYFSPVPCYFIPLEPKYLLQHPFSDIVSLRSSSVRMTPFVETDMQYLQTHIVLVNPMYLAGNTKMSRSYRIVCRDGI